ncbi:MAG: HPr family phosphocarrier protein [Lachnospiraceae bacterium]|jgi:phosphotransferase system HPr-like phosphotransfer protein|nr:HPr family phosphocarrier protein [Lachnospiraceae bacterium]SFT52402.1 PTS HPr component phosphorylation site [Lachnospiraceae bacterium XBD2001]MBQ1607875.1 HPr family phosphocarrier protein [Lachnospiraceae bacterium]MBQ1641072.1 HPr family phosphocarrier protein [Lachnospiraceae bacterium]MBQ1720996.1 HPr family phosphocarrier protein [Lachnospiraceae bacterium]
MKSIKVNINSIDKVKKFVNIITLFDNDFDLVAGRYVIDAKSIMGIFSLDLSQDLELVIQKDNDLDKILAELKDFIVE